MNISIYLCFYLSISSLLPPLQVESDASRGIGITNEIRSTIDCSTTVCSTDCSTGCSTVSVLTVERATMQDAGEYICRTSTMEFAFKRVRVLNRYLQSNFTHLYEGLFAAQLYLAVPTVFIEPCCFYWFAGLEITDLTLAISYSTFILHRNRLSGNGLWLPWKPFGYWLLFWLFLMIFMATWMICWLPCFFSSLSTWTCFHYYFLSTTCFIHVLYIKLWTLNNYPLLTFCHFNDKTGHTCMKITWNRWTDQQING